jgi:mannose-6-phosphate isomerase-like protein (cupin superfamily)
MVQAQTNRGPIVVGPEDGRVYPMGRIRAVFKADLGETAERYSVSEWWLEPRTRGPGAHQHEEDHVFYVISGMLSVLTGDIWSDAGAGTYVVIPGGTPHDFQNRGSIPAGFIAFTSPGGFEDHMGNVAPALSAEDLRL